MTVAALGGSVGSLLGMYTVRHKTKHPKFTIGIPLLLAGRIDATLNAEVVFADYQKAHPEANIKIATYSDDVEQVAIPVRKSTDTATLLAAIDQALAELDARAAALKLTGFENRLTTLEGRIQPVTQAEYNALTPGADTLYLIVEEVEA